MENIWRDMFEAVKQNTSDIVERAPTDSPAFTGVPTAPTAAPGTNTTQLATTAFTTNAVASAVTGLLDFKGSTDCSGNPNYPSALKGDAYIVSVAGKIGGASGKPVDIGDVYVASADNAGGTEASVGTSWFVLEHNLQGALLSANNLNDVASTSSARSNLGLVIGTNVEAHDADLTTIAGLSPSNDDVMQRKSGAWANRTLAQLRADLGIGRGVFKADRNGSGQTGLSTGAYNQIILNNEVVDVDNWFDSATNYRFTPQIAGWYFFEASCTDNSVNAGESPILAIYKNGAAAVKGNYVNTSAGMTLSFYVAQVKGILYMNGTTDYAELWIYKPTGTTIDGQVERTYLSGFLVRPD